MENELIELFSIIEDEVVDLQFGTATVTVVVINGVPVIDSLTIVKSKRKKYATIKTE